MREHPTPQGAAWGLCRVRCGCMPTGWWAMTGSWGYCSRQVHGGWATPHTAAKARLLMPHLGHPSAYPDRRCWNCNKQLVAQGWVTRWVDSRHCCPFQIPLDSTPGQGSLRLCSSWAPLPHPSSHGVTKSTELFLVARDGCPKDSSTTHTCTAVTSLSNVVLMHFMPVSVHKGC